MARRQLKIKIAGADWVVRWSKRRLLVDGHEVYGYCDPDEKIIRVRAELPDDLSRRTLLHEICHAWLRNHSTLISPKMEEAICELVAEGIIELESQSWFTKES